MADELLADLDRRMAATLENLRKEFAGLRTGRASASLLDPVMVDAYGSMMPLAQVASINVPEPRLISVQVWDKGMGKAVEKAIREAGLGLNPQADGQTIRVPIPDLTQERRKELAKVAGKYGEAAKIAVRNIRRDGMDTLKRQEKDKEISEDLHKDKAAEIQKVTDDFIKKVDDLQSAKEKEILAV